MRLKRKSCDFCPDFLCINLHVKLPFPGGKRKGGWLGKIKRPKRSMALAPYLIL